VNTRLLLFVFGDAAPFQLVRPCTFGNAHVIPVATNLQHEEQLSFLRGRRIQTVFECFEVCVRLAHALTPLGWRASGSVNSATGIPRIAAQLSDRHNATPYIPMSKDRGFTALFW